MKKSFIILSGLVAALAALVPAGSASAAEITYISVSGSWRDPVDNVPGSQPGDPVITNGTPTSSISWGQTSGSQSGYDFTATLPPPFTLPGPIPFFSLGSFTHRNFEVGDPSLTSVQLDVVLVLAVDGVPTGPLTFSYTFNHEETPNNPTPPDTCPYPTPPGDGCTDRVTIVASAEPTTFNVDGVDYTLVMSFLDDDGNPVSEFITREGGTINSSGLVGEFTLPPGLTVAKSGPVTMSRAEWGDFVIDVQNDAVSDAFNVTLVDRLPDGPTGGMCDTTPEVLGARVFASDGVTPLPGKGPLVQGTDYSLVYDSAACQLRFNTLTAASVIGVGERLVIAYRTQLDADTQDGITLTNVAGATQWFNDDATNPNRVAYRRTLTDGTVAIPDHQDAHTVGTNPPELRFEKTVANLSSGDDPAAQATPGDRLRYTLTVENLGDSAVSEFTLLDELDRLNAVPAFQPGTLSVVTVPAGADASASDPAGGASGTGLLEVRNLTLAAPGATLTVAFEATLAPVIADGTVVLNQSRLDVDGFALALSDDPNVNGPADPLVPDDEDPTRISIESAPAFVVQKTSDDLSGDPDVLLAGETLRYTITVRNIGSGHAMDAVLRDQVPANTSYVVGSTTLNGAAVADVAGLSPLVDGMPINAAGDPTPGSMPAGAAGDPGTQATVIFDVVVNADVLDGTIISNQGFVSAVAGGVADHPSDDPDTPIADDPTRDVVGNLPLLFADKRAVLQQDLASPGVVDPGDTLRYTITVHNSGAVDATGIVLGDVVPTNTTYLADSTRLNGLPLGQPDGGVFPLAAGVDLSSSDPGAGEGTISAGASAVLQFDLRVNDGVPAGTVISNQAVVASEALPDLLTDGDGDPATGPEPTIVIVGAAQRLVIAKTVAVVGGGPAVPGAQLEYLVRVANVAAVPVLSVVITDDLEADTPGILAYMDQSATLNGSSAAVSVAGSVLTADYAAAFGALEPGEVAVLRFRAILDPNLPVGTRVTNTGVVTWNTPPESASASVSFAIGGIPGYGTLNGKVWHDADFDDVPGMTERVLEGWTVELYRNGELLIATPTDADGAWRLNGLTPNVESDETYAIRFRAPWAGPSTASLGTAASAFINGPQEITGLIIAPGDNLLDLNLPIDPNGVVYDSIVRVPVAGSVLTLLDGGGSAALPTACFDDPLQQGQVTGPEGFYKFDLNFSDSACPNGAAYLISVAVPGTGFVAGYSAVIPPESGPATAPLSVPGCPGGPADAVPATTAYCEAQDSASAPPVSVPGRTPGTRYHVHVVLDESQAPGTSQIFNNHLPVDRELSGALAITKTTPSVNVSRGQLVPYTITVDSVFEFDLPDATVVDRYPAGFRYVEGSALLDGVPSEPAMNGLELAWSGLAIPSSGQLSIKLLLAAGAGVTEGEYVNRAQVVNGFTGEPLSGEATATVRIVPDPTFDCTDVTGKVFDDRNRNGFQDAGETGLQGVRLVTDRGLAATTDAHGRFHLTCAVTPREGRGSNFTLKLDDRTLPSGFRLSTDPIQIKRATRGKALDFDFGASIHRVVGLDVADPVFEPGSTTMRPQWRPRVTLLLEELGKAPATLRLSYVADVEDPELVHARLEAMKALILAAWNAGDRPYRLVVEPEIFWRLGAPAPRPSVGTRTGG